MNIRYVTWIDYPNDGTLRKYMTEVSEVKGRRPDGQPRRIAVYAYYSLEELEHFKADGAKGCKSEKQWHVERTLWQGVEKMDPELFEAATIQGLIPDWSGWINDLEWKTS